MLSEFTDHMGVCDILFVLVRDDVIVDWLECISALDAFEVRVHQVFANALAEMAQFKDE